MGCNWLRGFCFSLQAEFNLLHFFPCYLWSNRLNRVSTSHHGSKEQKRTSQNLCLQHMHSHSICRISRLRINHLSPKGGGVSLNNYPNHYTILSLILFIEVHFIQLVFSININPVLFCQLPVPSRSFQYRCFSLCVKVLCCK